MTWSEVFLKFKFCRVFSSFHLSYECFHLTILIVQYTEDCRHDMYPQHARSPGVPPTFKVDLDKDPSIRWNEVVASKSKEVQIMQL